MRILITGGSGQLGRALIGTLHAHDVVSPSSSDLDITNEALVSVEVSAIAPDVIVHCAAMTDTSRCEREPEEAHAVNALGAGYVAGAAARANAPLYAISTNEVFDGCADGPYAEDANANPVNAYGRSKLEGERMAVQRNPDTRVVRTSWLYGEGAGSFVARTLAAARDGRPMRYVTDEVASPTSAADLAEAVAALIELNAPPGVYHLVNEGEASRFEFAQEILRAGGLDASRVYATTTADLRANGYDGPLKPPRSTLANNRARALGVTLRPWDQGLAAHLAMLPAAAPHAQK